jgi:hypothetical protein
MMRRVALSSDWFWRTLLLAYLLCAPSIASAQNNPCDRLLQPIPGHTGYVLRSGRCEGLYISSVSAASLELISLLRGKLRYALQPNVRLLLSAPEVADIAPGPVRVRAIARPLRTYYRMDAVLPTTRQMAWPVDDVLLPLNLSAERIGVFGWLQRGAEKIFIPLRVAQPGDVTPEGPVELLVRATAAIERLVWRTFGSLPWQEAATQVAEGQPVSILLPEGPRMVVRLEVKAKVANSADWLNLPLPVLRDAP